MEKGLKSIILTQDIEKNIKNIKIKIDYFYKYMYYSIRVLEKVLKYYFGIGNKSQLML